ncbi:MAG: glycosyltransferase family 2 protein, partial [Desulfuromonadales bacterium]|nr:glycosyltransferase family 2 protein [Desulfuromonadales bacterium]
MTTLPSMTIAVITYNSSSYIVDCLESLQKSGVADSALMIVDDCSPDDTCAIVRERFPDVRVVALDRNGGHSRACNQAIKAVETEWIVLVDHDTEVKEDWYEQMCAAVVRHPDAGGIVSRAIFHNDGETIHSDGGYAHYIGNMRLRNGYTKLAQAEQGEEEIGAAGTTAMAVNREKALECGLFDEDFFIYLNDFEFSLRLRLLRYKLISAPDAVIYHKGGSQGVS